MPLTPPEFPKSSAKSGQIVSGVPALMDGFHRYLEGE